MNTQQNSLPLDLSQNRPFRCALVEMTLTDINHFHACLDLGLQLSDLVYITQLEQRVLAKESRPQELNQSQIPALQSITTQAGRLRVMIGGSPGVPTLGAYDKFDLVITTREEIEYFETLNNERRNRGLGGYDILCNPPNCTLTARKESLQPRRPFRLVSVGGTFNALHDGHREYLKLALRLADKVHILLASDAYAKQRKNYHPRRLDNRRRSIKAFLENLNCADRVEIETLKNVIDIERYVTGQNDLDLVVLEFAYMDWFDGWNTARTRNGHAAYSMLYKSRTTIDGIELSSSMIASERSSDQPSRQLPFFDSMGISALRLAATD